MCRCFDDKALSRQGVTYLKALTPHVFTYIVVSSQTSNDPS